VEDIFDNVLFSLGEYDIALSHLMGLLIVLLVVAGGYWLSAKLLKKYENRHKIALAASRKNVRLLLLTFLLIGVTGILFALQIDPVVGRINQFSLSLTKILIAITIVMIARIADNIISTRLDEEFTSRDPLSEEPSSHGAKIIQYIIVIICGYVILRNFGLDYTFHTDIANGTTIKVSISNVLIAALVIFVAQLIVWLLTNFFLQGFYRRRSIDIGKQYAYNQLFSYFIYFFAVLLASQHLGIKMTVIWAGAAALLVGIGIALQQTISDFFSGIVLLFERSVQVGDFLEIGEESGTLLRIGLRASAINTRENKTIIIPNSKLVNDNVVNWSNIEDLTRFDVRVGVAYGSDTELVARLLSTAVLGHKKVAKNPKPFARFLDFGDSSLNFGVYFFSKEYLKIEDVKSDIRFAIDKLFRENNVTIPFPQRDIWLKGQGKFSEKEDI
jgi:small-conductance mechanosensitive channel